MRLWPFTIVLAALIFAQSTVFAADPVLLRYIRAYGANGEQSPPVVLLQRPTEPDAVGDERVTIEFDIQSEMIPNVYARLFHCTADWEEDDSFVTQTLQRTTLFEWRIAPQTSRYYNYRGLLNVPNPQLDLRYSGNWKVKIFNMDNDEFLGETRIFVVDSKATCRFNFMTDFYEPKARVSSIALTLEAIISSRENSLIDPFLHTVVFYRNNRWTEPFIVSNKYENEQSVHDIGTATNGVFPAGKVFRVSRIPAQNEYRVLDLSNLAMFPFTGEPVRLPLSDQRRNGGFFERADDGALVTRMISSLNDEYVPIEFLLDPQPGQPSVDDVFVSGSFNNWKPNREWKMSYDPDLRMYRLRNWLRRGRHNYLYATGRLHADTDEIRNLSYEEWEGNTAANSNSYFAFAYYTVQEFGGYEGIVAVGSSNIYRDGR